MLPVGSKCRSSIDLGLAIIGLFLIQAMQIIALSCSRSLRQTHTFPRASHYSSKISLLAHRDPFTGHSIPRLIDSYFKPFSSASSTCKTHSRVTTCLNRDINTFRQSALNMVSESSSFYITTPIYYVNGDPHLGHAYTSVLCDIMARFWTLDGKDVLFLTGTDEHGQKVEQSANKIGEEPSAFADKNSAKFRDMLQMLNIASTDFIRTTEPRHKDSVIALWEKLKDNGMIYLGSYDGWYSVRDEAFYTESELIDGKAPTGAEVEWVKEESYFFKLSLFTEKLLKYYQDNPDFIGPKSRRNEVISFVSQVGGLRDLSISRTTFSWGIPVPNDSKHIVYVWLDALTNYLSAIGYPDSSEGSKLARYWPADVHIVGKDILRFHAIYWPAFLMAADISPPKRIYAHGWWTKDGEKMSKSLGNVIDPKTLISKYGVDYVRYFMVSEILFGNDGDFSDEAFVTRINSELANDIGNLFMRVLSFISKSCDNKIPQPQNVSEWKDEDRVLIAQGSDMLQVMRQAVYHQNMKQYADMIVVMSSSGNKYIDSQAPWVLRKNNDVNRLNTVLYVLAELLRQIGILLQPVMPASCKIMLDQLGVPVDKRGFSQLAGGDVSADTLISPGQVIQTPTPIFPKLEKLEESVVPSSSSSPMKESKKPKTSVSVIDSELLAQYSSMTLSDIETMIVSVGEDIKSMKASDKPDKDAIRVKVNQLQTLKESFKVVTGVQYQGKVKPV